MSLKEAAHIRNPVVNLLGQSIQSTKGLGPENQADTVLETITILSHFGFLPTYGNTEQLPEQTPSQLFLPDIYLPFDLYANSLVLQGKFHELKENGYDFSHAEIDILQTSRANRIHELEGAVFDEDQVVSSDAKRRLMELYGF